MSSADRLLSAFADDWQAGRRPDVHDFLARADPDDRGQLATLIGDWLALTSTPDYAPEVRAELAAEPLLREALDAAAFAREPVSARLPVLRERAGLSVADLAARVVARFKLGGGEDRAAAYLTELEQGGLDDRRVSRRLLDGLATILGADGMLANVATANWASPASSAALWRAESSEADAFEADMDALSRAALTPAPAPMDELDRLFLGGPEG